MQRARKTVLGLLGLAVTVPVLHAAVSRPDGRSVMIGVTMPFTGSGAQDSYDMLQGALLAVEEANAGGGAGGLRVNVLTLDDGTATAGGYDPAQSAVNARKLVANDAVVGNIGPLTGGSSKAMARIFNMAGLATITPSSTNSDLTDPKYAELFRPTKDLTYFRTVTTDAYQGPSMATFMARQLNARSVFILDDSGAYGVGLADKFQQQANRIGLTVLGRDRLDPLKSDYTAVLTKVRGLNPDALYCACTELAGVKVLKQARDILPARMIKAGGDGLHSGSILSSAGSQAAEGWYSTMATRHVLGTASMRPWVERYIRRWGAPPSQYSITSYDAAKVLLGAVATVSQSGRAVTRESVREAIRSGRVAGLQGEIRFDANGDLLWPAVSIFQSEHDPRYPADDVIHQYRFIGVAPL